MLASFIVKDEMDGLELFDDDDCFTVWCEVTIRHVRGARVRARDAVTGVQSAGIRPHEVE